MVQTAKPRLGYSNGTVSAKRTTSGQFTQLSPAQVRELKEAFTLLDMDGDGSINQNDLAEMLTSLGHDTTDDYTADMLLKMPSPLTFSSFLTGMSAHLSDVSSREELLAAFEAFVDDDGVLRVEDLREALIEGGMTRDQVVRATESNTKQSFRGDTFNYKEFTGMLRATDE